MIIGYDSISCINITFLDIMYLESANLHVWIEFGPSWTKYFVTLKIKSGYGKSAIARAMTPLAYTKVT